MRQDRRRRGPKRGGNEYGVTYVGLSSNAFKLIENLEMRQVRCATRKVA